MSRCAFGAWVLLLHACAAQDVQTRVKAEEIPSFSDALLALAAETAGPETQARCGVSADAIDALAFQVVASIDARFALELGSSQLARGRPATQAWLATGIASLRERLDEARMPGALTVRDGATQVESVLVVASPSTGDDAFDQAWSWRLPRHHAMALLTLALLAREANSADIDVQAVRLLVALRLGRWLGYWRELGVRSDVFQRIESVKPQLSQMLGVSDLQLTRQQLFGHPVLRADPSLGKARLEAVDQLVRRVLVSACGGSYIVFTLYEWLQSLLTGP